jgi:hypothetical protein
MQALNRSKDMYLTGPPSMENIGLNCLGGGWQLASRGLLLQIAGHAGA